MNEPTDPLLGDVGRRWCAEHPELGDGRIPVRGLHDPEQFERERKRAFRRTWLHVGREDELPGPGDYIVKDIAVLRTSLLLVRGDDGVIRGFHNVCSHRVNKLAWDDCGHAARGFSCKFHSWTYDLRGRLVHLPDAQMFPGLDRAEHGLTPVAAQVWQGFVFVNFAPEPAQDLRSYLGGVGAALQGYPFGEMTESYRYRAVIECNWKVGVDAFSEAYHAPYLHRLTFEDSLSGPLNPDCHLLDVRLDHAHRHSVIYANPDYRPSPVGALAYALGGASVAKRERDLGKLPPGVNPSRSPYWAFAIDGFFPNYNLYVSADNYLSHQFWPISPTRSLWEGRLYFRPAGSAAERFAHEYARSLQLGAWLEDTGTMENTQQVLASGAKTHYILGEQEVLIRHFYQVLNRYLADGDEDHD